MQDHLLAGGGRHPGRHRRLGVKPCLSEVPLEKLFERWQRAASDHERERVQVTIGSVGRRLPKFGPFGIEPSELTALEPRCTARMSDTVVITGGIARQLGSIQSTSTQNRSCSSPAPSARAAEIQHICHGDCGHGHSSMFAQAHAGLHKMAQSRS